jgi:hypothetical protein
MKVIYSVEVVVLRLLFSHTAIEESESASIPHDSLKIKTTRYFEGCAA